MPSWRHGIPRHSIRSSPKQAASSRTGRASPRRSVAVASRPTPRSGRKSASYCTSAGKPTSGRSGNARGTQHKTGRCLHSHPSVLTSAVGAVRDPKVALLGNGAAGPRIRITVAAAAPDRHPPRNGEKMAIADAFLPEYDHEIATTRTLLERVPAGKPAWKPHVKSMELGRLSMHIAELPTWVGHTLRQTELDVAPADPSERHVAKTFTTTQAMVADFDAHAKEE